MNETNVGENGNENGIAIKRPLAEAGKYLRMSVPLVLFGLGITTFVQLILLSKSIWADSPASAYGLLNCSLILIIGSIVVSDVRKIRAQRGA